MNLVDIKEMKVVLRGAKSSKIKLFHKLIFDEEGNRKRLRRFSGFPFEIGSQEFEAILNEKKVNFLLVN